MKLIEQISQKILNNCINLVKNYSPKKHLVCCGQICLTQMFRCHTYLYVVYNKFQYQPHMRFANPSIYNKQHAINHYAFFVQSVQVQCKYNTPYQHTFYCKLSYIHSRGICAFVRRTFPPQRRPNSKKSKNRLNLLFRPSPIPNTSVRRHISHHIRFTYMMFKRTYVALASSLACMVSAIIGKKCFDETRVRQFVCAIHPSM